MAENHYGRENVCSHGDYVGKSIQKISDYPFVSGHFGYTLAKQLMRDRYSFTFLRSPIERVLSYYSFCRSRDPDEYEIYRMANSMELKEFLVGLLSDRSMKWQVFNGQVWYLACGPGDNKTRINYIPSSELVERASANLQEFSYIGFTESFVKDRAHILNALKMPQPRDDVRVNVTENRLEISDLSLDELTLLEEITALDQVLYQQAWSRRTRP